MDIPHTNIVYHFEQRVEIMCRESERTNPVNEVYTRNGIILLSAGVTNGHWRRELTEYETTPQELAKIRQKDRVDLAALQEAHLKALESRKNQFGLDLPVEVESDMHNHNVAIAGSEHVPLREDLLYLPTLLPEVPPKRAEPGQEWSGSIDVMAGAGRFPISYTARMLDRRDENPIIQVTLRAHPSSQTIKGITLTLTPQGQLTLSIAKADGSPLQLEGDTRISVRAKLHRDDAPVDVEVLNCHQTFKLTRVPASFNEDYFLPAGWKAPPEQAGHSP